MTVIDTTFDRVFEELRADRAELMTEMRALRTELRDDMRMLDSRLDDRLSRLDDRLSQLGFRAAGILAAGLIALVATQL